MSAMVERVLQRLVRIAVITAIICSALIGGGRPASALTANEKFVVAFYEDFLQRGPSTDEMTWWTAYLGTGSRATMASSLFASDEFENLWLIGTRMYYLSDVEVEDPSFAADMSALQSTGDFVASEVSVLASADYFVLHGSTNTGFVEGIYNNVLLRPSDPTGLAFWVARLDAGTWTRAQVAAAFIRTTEAANRRVGGTNGATTCASTVLVDQDALTSGSYCIVLDRLVDPSGYAYWSGQLAGSGQIPALWTSLAASNEYFSNAQA